MKLVSTDESRLERKVRHHGGPLPRMHPPQSTPRDWWERILIAALLFLTVVFLGMAAVGIAHAQDATLAAEIVSVCPARRVSDVIVTAGATDGRMLRTVYAGLLQGGECTGFSGVPTPTVFCDLPTHACAGSEACVLRVWVYDGAAWSDTPIQMDPLGYFGICAPLPTTTTLPPTSTTLAPACNYRRRAQCADDADCACSGRRCNQKHRCVR